MKPGLNGDMFMEQNLKLIVYTLGAMCLHPQTLHAQSVNIEGLDSLRLSGSISVVEPELLKKGVLHNALDALSGQTAGVNVTTNGLDRIAMLNSVRVRGTTSIMGGNDPLVIIDGVTSDVATLATIYPADIESFTVLKNASETRPLRFPWCFGCHPGEDQEGYRQGIPDFLRGQLRYRGDVQEHGNAQCSRIHCCCPEVWAGV